jgi:sugar lactone lactonase YvrE
MKPAIAAALLLSTSILAVGPAGAVPLGDKAKAAADKLTGKQGPASIERVATFQHQVTGVAVSETGRIFVNFPRWSEDAPISLAELTPDGKLHPYPDEEWNRYRNAAPLAPDSHFVCVQAETADGHGSLWVIDPAAPNTEFIVPGGPKLVKIDLASNKVSRVYAFDTSVAPQGSYLNDVRLSPDGKTAYITDSGASGAIVVVDLDSGKGRRLLDGDVSTQADKSVKVTVNGRELKQPDGRGVQFAADSISIDPKGEYLYWQPLTGKVLYRVPTAALADASLPPDQMSRKVEKVADSEPNDGLWTDAGGHLFFTAIQRSAVDMSGPDGKRTTLVSDPRLRWPDTFAEGPGGVLYVTNSDITDSPRFNGVWKTRFFNLWKIVPGKAGLIDKNPAFGGK